MSGRIGQKHGNSQQKKLHKEIDMQEKMKAVIEVFEEISEPVLDENGNKVLDKEGNVIYKVVETHKQTIEEK